MPILALAVLATLAASPRAFGAEPYRELFECMKSIQSCSAGAERRTGADAGFGANLGATLGLGSGIGSGSGSQPVPIPPPVELSVVPTALRLYGILLAARAGKPGFYALSGTDGLFFEFPPPPPKDESVAPPAPSIWNLYGLLTRILAKEKPKVDPHVYYKVELGISDPLFVSFRRAGDGSLSLESAQSVPFVGRVPDPAKGLACGGEAEVQAAARDAVVRQLATVYSTFQSAPAPSEGDVSEEYNLVGREARITFKRENCLKTLEPCLSATALSDAAAAEKRKFEK